MATATARLPRAPTVGHEFSSDSNGNSPPSTSPSPHSSRSPRRGRITYGAPPTSTFSGSSSYPFSSFVDPENEWDDDMYDNETDGGEVDESEGEGAEPPHSNPDMDRFIFRSGDFANDTDDEEK